ncbi:MOSC domain-containing protein [Corynebacterium pelargi]|uniref:6-N-hydroxylaminopurine resistance protein n=1 Tax=Corynebacterium pelargi TaxID=1471400 RepID=A0A410W7D6_9CORY|nr:MOSC domain-containing protein [Corynebacterium pelargi]QAU51860.1 6-N-hydroxylaminopurine resistance protein [Corynebacterium pelargi]GGG71910.1 molybdenum cofactor biosysynthesis protein [Corynebacterium pelargi]
MKILSTNVAVPQADPGGADRVSGIDKQPRERIRVSAPGPSYGDGSGVESDVIGDTKHHGGAEKAVYAFAREELDYWQKQLGRELRPGVFGENLTTTGVDWSAQLINQRMRIGSAVLEVSISRQPCRTFAAWLEQRGWVKRFAEHGDCGAYLRVIEAGEIRPGDSIELFDAPTHALTMRTLFAANMGDREAMAAVLEADCVAPMYRERFEKMLRSQ